jgi:hypothetical protein
MDTTPIAPKEIDLSSPRFCGSSSSRNKRKRTEDDFRMRMKQNEIIKYNDAEERRLLKMEELEL